MFLSVRLLGGYVKKPGHLSNPLAAAGLVRGPAAVRDITPRTVLNSKLVLSSLMLSSLACFSFTLPFLLFAFLPFLAFHAFLLIPFPFFIFLLSSLPFSPPPIFLLLFHRAETGSSWLENDLHECSTVY